MVPNSQHDPTTEARDPNGGVVEVEEGPDLGTFGVEEFRNVWILDRVKMGKHIQIFRSFFQSIGPGDLGTPVSVFVFELL